MPESDLGGRSDPGWYWRRAAKRWRDQAETSRRLAKEVAAALTDTPFEVLTILQKIKEGS